MTPEFDEEVVFENSPLYQYLQDLGHTDFEICSAVSQKTEQCTAEEGQQDTRSTQKWRVLFSMDMLQLCAKPKPGGKKRPLCRLLCPEHCRVGCPPTRLR
uniref:Vezatin, adherens junctions transmembrane protein n=1 Tax=Terrapene triunguis TaxID=2587831 RepID=A0A674ICE0_9SAUR